MSSEYNLKVYKMLLATMEAEPVAWDYNWAHCVTCEGPQDWGRVIEREPPPDWAIADGRVRGLIALYQK